MSSDKKDPQLDLLYWNDPVDMSEALVGFIDDGDSWSKEPPVPVRPEAPKIKCWVCDKEPKTLSVWAAEYYLNPFYKISGQCCGRGFSKEITFDDIVKKEVKSYIVNME